MALAWIRQSMLLRADIDDGLKSAVVITTRYRKTATAALRGTDPVLLNRRLCWVWIRSRAGRVAAIAFIRRIAAVQNRALGWIYGEAKSSVVAVVCDFVAELPLVDRKVRLGSATVLIRGGIAIDWAAVGSECIAKGAGIAVFCHVVAEAPVVTGLITVARLGLARAIGAAHRIATIQHSLLVRVNGEAKSSVVTVMGYVIAQK